MTRYPWQLLQRLASQIENHQVPEAHRSLDRVLAIIAENPPGNLTLRKLRCAQVVSMCLRGAHRGGAPSEIILTEHLQMLERLALQKTWKALRLLMDRYVDQLLNHVRPLQRTDVECFVARMRKDMFRTIASPKSLAQYAEAASLSAGYLSRCFTSIVGSTFREELRRLRMEKARRLLAKKNLKISTVAKLVGLQDPSQFISQFRQQTGQTPGAYRQTHRR
jgi:AraC-like DNA-binding protein